MELSVFLVNLISIQLSDAMDIGEPCDQEKGPGWVINHKLRVIPCNEGSTGAGKQVFQLLVVAFLHKVVDVGD